MKVIRFSKILILLMLISSMVGCNNTKTIDKPTDYEHIMDNTAENIDNCNNIKIDEMNIGNRKCFAIKDGNIYYIDTNNKNQLYVIDNQFKNRKMICDRYVLDIVSVTDDKIYFVQVIEQDERTRLYDICSINKNGDSYKVIVKDVISAVLLNGKFYYYRLTDEVADEAGNEFCSFCSFDINSNEERAIDIKIVGETQPVLYKDKIYYVGSNSEFIEYNLDTEEKKKLNVNIEFLYRYSDDNIYAYKVNAVEKIDLYSNAKTVILPEMKEMYFIWEMNVTKDYVFFLAQDTKEVENEIYRLNLYRMKKDGSELKKIHSTDYTRDIIFAEHFIYDIGDKLLLYERNENNYLSSRNKFQLIDYEGNEIDSSVININ